MQSRTQTLTSKPQANLRVMPSKREVTRAEIENALDQWGKNLVAISRAKRAGEDYKAIAKAAIERTYDYQNGSVLFKPTLASERTFRTTFEGALSYFVGGNTQFPEDRGFALNPWDKVQFDLAGVILGDKHGIVMGNKLLTDVNGKVTIANFTMGFVRDSQGELKINLHHSSLPYTPN